MKAIPGSEMDTQHQNHHLVLFEQCDIGRVSRKTPPFQAIRKRKVLHKQSKQ